MVWILAPNANVFINYYKVIDMIILFRFMIFFFLFLPMVIQPLRLGLLVIALSVVFSLVLGISGFSVYGFVLFLIFVGGLLVMFGYVVVLIPNILFSFSFSYFFFFVVFLVSWFDYVFILTFHGVDFLFVSYGFLLYVGLGLVLLYCLLVVVKICFFHSGSLRPFFIA